MNDFWRFIIKIVIIVLLTFTLCCCQNNKKIKIIIQEWQNKEIIFPDSLNVKIAGEKINTFKLPHNKYKILNYIDTNGCTPCRMKIYNWQQLKEETDSLNLDISYIFIIAPNKNNESEILQKINKCSIPFIEDNKNIIASLNKFPTIPGLQTFLLDSNYRVLLIGNPIENPNIKELYIKTISLKY